MKLIKLNATASTNSYLRELSKHKDLESFTVVVAKNQTNGRGQINSIWQSEHGKNLIFSIFIRFEDLKIDNQFYLSKVVSVALASVIRTKINAEIQVKWPNDILAGRSKIAGILIESSVKKTKLTETVIGIGLNVLQTKFDNLSNVTSFKILKNKDVNFDQLLKQIVNSLKFHIAFLIQNKFEAIDELYFEYLYNYNIPAMYKDQFGTLFMGKIVGITRPGKLQVELEDETISEFDLKEIEFVSLKM